ncbi:NAD-dependent epimerase/dehydratase family protein [Aureimonas altamirensis]|uniref:NAD-dependent epimerase/dehydratase family protein n=1 Tax=Aureimonas altamirensis TaxID=370622 RepID=UPI00203736C8|nr:NAD-dependent epimerase/dehydratase family protein [Aureimonas altamirensis]MCM2505946.1 NAD-dependent epimerase/dehydratase family protein [Aureimonas altamirensis]
MTVTVLGGGGFIGTHVSHGLVKSGFDVRVFGRHFLDRSLLAGAELFEGDFNDETVLATALQDTDIIIHLIHATFPTVANVEMIADIERSVMGSVRMLEAARANGVKRIIFFSSGGTVYGPTAQTPISETAATNPIGAYGINKLAIEKYVALFERLHGIEGFVLRLANPFGPLQTGRRQQGLIPNVYSKIKNYRKVPIYGDGSNIRDYIYIDDVVSSVHRIIEYNGYERCFNVGSATRGKTIIDVVKSIENSCGVRADLEFLPSRSFDVPENVLCCQRLIDQTNWRPTVAFDTGIERTIRWLENHAAM